MRFLFRPIRALPPKQLKHAKVLFAARKTISCVGVVLDPGARCWSRCPVARGAGVGAIPALTFFLIIRCGELPGEAREVCYRSRNTGVRRVPCNFLNQLPGDPISRTIPFRGWEYRPDAQLRTPNYAKGGPSGMRNHCAQSAECGEGKCCNAGSLTPSEDRKLGTSLIPFAFRAWWRSSNVRRLKNCFFGAT